MDTFIIFYISIAFLLGEIIIPYILRQSDIYKSILLIITLIIIFIQIFYIYHKFSSITNNLNIVGDQDYKIFTQINNIDGIILNNAIKSTSSIQEIVFPTDAGGWIYSFTGYRVAMPFSEFHYKKTHEIYNNYQILIHDPGDCNALNYLINNNISYYFDGSILNFGGSEVQINSELLDRNVYEIIFANNGSTLYKINGCKDQ